VGVGGCNLTIFELAFIPGNDGLAAGTGRDFSSDDVALADNKTHQCHTGDSHAQTSNCLNALKQV